MARVSVLGETFGDGIREVVVGRAVNETHGSGGDVVLDVVRLNVSVLVLVGLSRQERSGDARSIVLPHVSRAALSKTKPRKQSAKARRW